MTFFFCDSDIFTVHKWRKGDAQNCKSKTQATANLETQSKKCCQSLINSNCIAGELLSKYRITSCTFILQLLFCLMRELAKRVNRRLIWRWRHNEEAQASVKKKENVRVSTCMYFSIKECVKVCVWKWVKTSEHCVQGPCRGSVLASPRYRYRPPPLWHDGRKMIRGTGDNGSRDFCLYPGQCHCQVQQHYTQKKRRGAPHKRAPFLV